MDSTESIEKNLEDLENDIKEQRKVCLESIKVELEKRKIDIWTIVNKVDRKNENSTYWGQASTRLLGFGASSPKVFI